LGPPFFWEGKTAQRFDYGFILAGPGGQGSFIPYEDAPSAVPPLTGAFSGGGAALQDRLRGAFGTALREERDRRVRFASPFDPYAGGPPLIPDGPVEYLDFGAEPWNLPFPRREIQVRGIYIQFFDQGRTAFILPDSPDLPFTVKTLAAPYLDALMTVPEETPVETASGFSSPLPGAETLKAGRGLHAAEPARDLLRGMSLYGVPLTSGMPGEADGRILRVQRFSGGWMIHDE
jgi:hypothetical protein